MSKIILFDFDGTIVDCQRFQIARLKNVFMHFGVDIKGIDFLKLIGPPLYNTFSKYISREKAQEVLDYYNNSFDPKKIRDIKLFDGIKRMLIDLKKDGHNVCLTSLQFDSVVKAELKYLGIADLFDNVYCDDAQTAYKTKVDLVADVLNYKGYNIEDVVLVGDTDNDVIAGTKNNLFTVAVKWGYGDVDNAKVDEVISKPGQLVSLVNRLDKQSTLKMID